MYTLLLAQQWLARLEAFQPCSPRETRTQQKLLAQFTRGIEELERQVGH